LSVEGRARQKQKQKQRQDKRSKKDKSSCGEAANREMVREDMNIPP
jgi:hypothetical protein